MSYGHEQSLRNRVSALIKRDPRALLCLATTGRNELALMPSRESGSGLSPVTESAGALILDFYPPQLSEVVFVVHKSLNL